MNIIEKPLKGGYEPNEPKRGIIHAMGEYIVHDGEELHAYDLLKKLGLSAHILICPNGDIIKCRDEDKGAWHAKGHNAGTLGAEFLIEGSYDYPSFLKTMKRDYVTQDQYDAGVDYIREHWVERLGVLHFERHSDVDPDRKQDPGDGFPWLSFLVDIGVLI